MPDERVERLDEGAQQEGVDEDDVPALHSAWVEVAEELYGEGIFCDECRRR